MKKVFSLITLLALLMFVFQINIVCYAEDINRFPDISLTSNFADDRVIVVFNNESSLKFKQYTETDFDGIACKTIIDLSSSLGKTVRNAMENVEQHVSQGESLITYTGIPLNQYHQTICIKLENGGKKNVVDAVKQLRERSDVLYAIPDYQITVAEAFPDDEIYNDTRSQYNNLKYIVEEELDLDKVWDNICTGLPNDYSENQAVRVGVIDTGIDEDHMDLQNNINSTLCKDFTQFHIYESPQDCNHEDNSYHGTLCAGIIGAEGNNGIGIAGVCWNIELVSLKVLDSDKLGYASNVAAAINYANAEDVKLDVLNMSIGYSSLDDEFEIYYADFCFNTMIANFNGIAVCSAGNDGKNVDNITSEFYPTQYTAPNLIVVGASEGNNIYAESNYGDESVDLFAPGVNICSTYPVSLCSQGNHPDKDKTFCAYDDYHSSSGTSFAAPFVTGTVALMLCIDKDLDPLIVKDKIMRSVDKKSAYERKCVSGGRLNIFNAVARIVDHSNHSKTYEINSALAHNTTCTVCEYTYSEDHKQMNANSLSVFQGHTAICLYCGYTGTFDHDWLWTNNLSAYRCSICRVTSSIIPTPNMDNCTDELIVAIIPSNKEEFLE